jgi:methionyl-tRNA formyltransferase
MIVDALRRMEAGAIEAVPQPEGGVTYAAKILKEEAALSFDRPALELARKIRAFNPFPGAHAQVGGVTVKLWNADVVDAPAGQEPGTVIGADADGVLIACREGGLRVTELQKPGGKRLPAAQFIKSFPLAGQRLG